MDWVLTREIREFTANAQAFLEARRERNVLATVTAHVQAGRYARADCLFGYGRDGSGVIAAAIRTAPWPMLVVGVSEAEAETLVPRWLAEDPDLPGVSGEPAAARAVAAAWECATGGVATCRMREAMHALSTVEEPPRPAPGALRLARGEEFDLLVEWELAFRDELAMGDAPDAAAIIDDRLARRAQYVWDDDGPACTVALSPRVASIQRIGPVYTPRERRRHGYATSAVAAASRLALADGARECMLLTDLANPTSNKIYADIGYRRFADWEDHVFEPDAG